MKKMTSKWVLCGAIMLSLLCVSASSLKPKSQSDRLSELEKQNLELRKQVVDLNQKLEILTRRVNENCGATGSSGRGFSEESLSSAGSSNVPNLGVVRLSPGAGPAAPAAPGRNKGRLIISNGGFGEDPAIVTQDPIPGTNYRPLPDPAGGNEPPPILMTSPAPSAPAAPVASIDGEGTLAAGEANAYKQLKELWDAGKTDLAVPLMVEYLKRHARGAHEDEVAYRLGDYYFSQNDFNRTIPTLRKVTENHPASSLAPDALYKIGLCYLELGKDEDAENALQEVEILYPFSEAATKAAKKLESVR